MAMMRFNKIRLPELPDVDRTIYPYAYITTTEYDSKYYLYFSPVVLIATANADGDIGLIAPDELDVLGLSNSGISKGDTEWTELAECTLSASEPILYPAWSDTDIYHADETLYLSASEPVEADIMYYYNGVYLPMLPPWNTEYYPYAFITTPEEGRYLLRFTHEPLVYRSLNTGTELFILNAEQEEFTYGKCDLMNNGTVDFDPEITYDKATAFDATSWVWSNYDIRSVDDGSVIKSASEPSLEYVPPDDGGDTGGGGGSGDSGGSGESGDTTVYVCSDWRIPFILGLFAPLTWNPASDQRLTWAALEALALIFEDIEGITWDEFEFYK